MQIYRLIFVFFLIFLTGCDQQRIDKLSTDKKSLQDQIFQLQNQIQEAQAKIDQDYATKKAVFDELEYQAGIAAGCRHFGINHRTWGFSPKGRVFGWRNGYLLGNLFVKVFVRSRGVFLGTGQLEALGTANFVCSKACRCGAG